MALVELVSIPLQKSSTALGTGVSLCHFPSLIFSAVCLFVCLFLRSAFQPLAVVSRGSLPTIEHIGIGNTAKTVFL